MIVNDPRWVGKPKTIDLPANTVDFALIPISGGDMVEITSRAEFDLLIATGASDAAIKAAALADFATDNFTRYPASVGVAYVNGQAAGSKICVRSSTAVGLVKGISYVQLRTT